MKNCLLLFFFLVGSIQFTFSQDIITLKSGGDEIKAKVEEVGATEVKYKKYNNPDGPTYTLQRSEIFVIRYANGTKDYLKSAPAPVPDGVYNNTSTPAPQNNYSNNQNNGAAEQMRKNEEERARVQEDEARQARAAEITTQINQLKRIRRGDNGRGAGCMVVGILCAGAGAALLAIGASDMNSLDENTDPTYDDDVSADTDLMGAGAGLLVAGVVCAFVGGPIEFAAAHKVGKQIKALKAEKSSLSYSLNPIIGPYYDNYGHANGVKAGLHFNLNF